jgi:hypothetical protein
LWDKQDACEHDWDLVSIDEGGPVDGANANSINDSVIAQGDVVDW